MSAATAMKGEVAIRLAWLTLAPDARTFDPEQPKRAVVLFDAAERSRKTTAAVGVLWQGESFTYRGGRLEVYTHPALREATKR